ncbi:MotA/TolQ/ExbB proton channel family protein [Shewanella eurypsychrophilus]|uniref:MotA/TolQ/ExbB proton channel family protein n=1 Tax=Shewanella eurypsychrophilus TaxID=2593656 RepID=A0ABX6VCZ9_9GAMM|nr:MULTISPECIES: MotA/TolQ/ExbB proton channel family protein [Shewanella]QPG60402.2 MotA/TolQ/ExbB proton channel family protein [Shewanella eurypsychrophilus]
MNSPDWLIQGGWCLWLLIALSIVSFSVCIYKFISFIGLRLYKKNEYQFWLDAIPRIENMTHTDYTNKRISPQHPATRLMKFCAVSLASSLDKQALENKLSFQAEQEIDKLKSGMRILEVISALAPLIGLLGTVLGMIDSFQSLQQAGSKVDPAMLSGGISQALITTAAGLIVAIPTTAAWHYLDSLTTRQHASIEHLLTEYLSLPMIKAKFL